VHEEKKINRPYKDKSTINRKLARQKVLFPGKRYGDKDHILVQFIPP